MLFGHFPCSEENPRCRARIGVSGTAGAASSREIAGTTYMQQTLGIFAPDLPCVCAGLLRLRVFLRYFFAGPQNVPNHLARYRVRWDGVVSIAILVGISLTEHRAQVCPHRRSVCVRILSSGFSQTLSLPLGGAPRATENTQGFEACDRRCDFSTSDGEQEPVGLALRV